MKNKILIALLFLTNFSSAFAQTSIGIGEKILLLPIHTCIPMDSDHNNGRGETDFNQICAIIKGKDLYVKAGTDMPARAEIRKEGEFNKQVQHYCFVS